MILIRKLNTWMKNIKTPNQHGSIRKRGGTEVKVTKKSEYLEFVNRLQVGTSKMG